MDDRGRQLRAFGARLVARRALVDAAMARSAGDPGGLGIGQEILPAAAQHAWVDGLGRFWCQGLPAACAPLPAVDDGPLQMHGLAQWAQAWRRLGEEVVTVLQGDAGSVPAWLIDDLRATVAVQVGAAALAAAERPPMALADGTLQGSDAGAVAALKTLMQQFPIPQALLSARDLRVLFVNEAFRRCLGPRDYQGQPLAVAMADDEIDDLIALMREGTQPDRPMHAREVTVSVLDAAGCRRRLVLGARLFVLRPTAAELDPCIILSLMDITDQARARQDLAQAQAAIRAERDNTRNLFKQTGLAVAILKGPQHVFAYANPTLEKGVGGPLAGKPFRQAMSAFADGVLASVLDEVYRTGRALSCDQLAAQLGGEVTYLNISCVPHRGLDGTTDGIMLLASDVGGAVRARQRSEELLRMLDTAHRGLAERARADRRFRHSFSHAHVGMAVADEEGLLTDVNPAFERITGYSAADLRGRAILGLAHPDDLAANELAERNLRDGVTPSTSLETRYLHADGSTVWVALSVTENLGEAGEPTQTIWLVTDICARKEAEAHQQRVHGELRAAIRARDDFLSIASHELKTPLTSLSLRNQLTRRRLGRRIDQAGLRAMIDQLCDRTDHSSRQLLRLVDDMLDVSRLTTGKLALAPEPCDLSTLAAEVVEAMRQVAERTGAPLSLASCQPAPGHWDRLRITQVLTNLVSNAIRYGKKSPVTVEVAVSGGECLARIRDRGPGIAAEKHQKIFDRFERVDAAAAPAGLGLGLYICSQIVERHRGRIELDSEVGQGSTFTVALPLARLSS